MNINPKIFTANGEELASYTLFHDMIKVMKASDGIEPIGACCGRNTSQIINLFISNKQKYVDFMENIRKRLIKPLRKGLVYVNPMKQMLNYELMTDNEILLCVKKGYLSEKIFDWTEYNNVQKPIVKETPAAESVEVEIPVAESPAESPVEEETPAAEPIDDNAQKPVEEETPIEKPIVEKPKRSSKKGSK